MRKNLLRIVTIILLIGIVAFLWPRSLADVPFQPQSVRVLIINRQHEQTMIEFPVESPELDTVMDLLDQYSCHCSFRTIPSLFDNGPSIHGNNAGFWVMIDLYSEPNYQGELFGITSGGTKEIIWGRAVRRVGYWGNSKNLQFTMRIKS